MDSTSNQAKSQLVLRPQSNVSKALANKFRIKGQLLEYMKMKCKYYALTISLRGHVVTNQAEMFSVISPRYS